MNGGPGSAMQDFREESEGGKEEQGVEAAKRKSPVKAIVNSLKGEVFSGEWV